ncbi:unnamed protein product [Spirodela intermedia]|uniref:Uncharacterized protein n=1 Tax=Spirodela intermedia TaxID=51605 RepID=A0A7I8JDE8_SPIIN|nr:unnamed protein product [Spirodela intermedia]CAA6668021.1 unnamed protein product [Spirodela intermedia]
MAEEDADAVLSDVDGDEDPVPIVLSAGKTSPMSSSSDDAAVNQRIRDLQAELDRERQARKVAEDAHADLQNTFARLKVLAHEAIRKRDEALRDKEEAARSSERAAVELAEAARFKEEILKQKEEATRQLDEAMRQKDASRSEMESAAQMMVTGIEKISSKVGRFKYMTGLPSVAYGVIKRTNVIVEELVRQVDSAEKDRNEARELVEQRNYEIAIEVSQLEATIAGLREEVSRKSSEIEDFEKSVGEKDGKITELAGEITQLRLSGSEYEAKWKGLQEKLDSQRLVVMDLLKYISRAHEQVSEIIENAESNEWDRSESSESQFMWKDMDMEENLRTSLEGTVSVCELAKVAAEKVRTCLEEKKQEVDCLSQKVAQLLAEKSHIGTLLRSALSSKMSEVRKVAANGPREAGVDLRFDDYDKEDVSIGKEDEVYRLAGVLEDTVKTSQLEIIELQHQVEALRAECSLLKTQLGAHAKEIGQQKHRIKELEEKEHLANESVEGLMMDIAAAEEEIARWKLAAEQEAAAGRAIEQEFVTQLSSLRQELEDAKQAVSELESKLKFKEETSMAAIAARDAAEKSLRLADMRSARLRERLEELTQQLGESENVEESRSQLRQRYICWPWQWLGLNIVHHQVATQESSNEMELSEPLI